MLRTLLWTSMLASTGCTVLWDADWAQRVDPDNDGVEFPFDCDDRDPNVGKARRMFRDDDGDHWGADDRSEDRCPTDAGWVVNDGDCNDTVSAIYPGAPELCDGLDNDCDGGADDGMQRHDAFPDEDGDGYGDVLGRTSACYLPDGYVTIPGDCNDADPAFSPLATEICDGLDNDCDRSVDEDLTTLAYEDDDGDGYGNAALAHFVCVVAAGDATNPDDCNDNVATINPAAVEDCANGIDDDCDGITDVITAYTDADGDGDGDPTTATEQCPMPHGWVVSGGDCDDADPLRSSLLAEVCPDDIDNDCNGHVDYITEWADVDGDGFGDPGTKRRHCTSVVHFVSNDFDCLDSSRSTPVAVDALHGSSGGTGSLDDPFATLNEGLDAGASCLIVLPGTYAETLELGRADLSMTSAKGPDETFIDPALPACTIDRWPACQPTVQVIGTKAISITGFTITGGSGYPDYTSDGADTTRTTCGGGVYAEGASLTLSYDRIVGMALPDEVATTDSAGAVTTMTSAGGGICIRGGAVDLVDVRVKNNHAAAGGAISVDDGAVVTGAQVIMEGNTAAEGAGFWLGEGTFDAAQVRSWCNVATGYGGAFFLGNAYADLTLSFADLAYDQVGGTDLPAEIDGVAGSTVTLDDAIVFGTNGDTTLGGQGSMRVTWSIVGAESGASVGDGVYMGDGFATTASALLTMTCNGDSTDDSFVLPSGSPALDAGDPTLVDADGTRADVGSNGGSGGAW